MQAIDSDTSSYVSSDDNQDVAPLEVLEEKCLGEDEEHDPTVQSTASRLRTQNEVEDPYKLAPPMPVLDELDHITDFGNVQFVIPSEKVLLVAPKDLSTVYALDNIVCFESREVIGFLSDVVGQVSSPLYSIQIYPEALKGEEDEQKVREAFQDKKVFLVNKCMKVVGEGELKQGKGCDASNLYDEELGAENQEFSDDEEERRVKKMKKQNKKRKKNERGDASKRQRMGHSIPMYSAIYAPN